MDLIALSSYPLVSRKDDAERPSRDPIFVVTAEVPWYMTCEELEVSCRGASRGSMDGLAPWLQAGGIASSVREKHVEACSAVHRIAE